jgi:hypothetical protein
MARDCAQYRTIWSVACSKRQSDQEDNGGKQIYHMHRPMEPFHRRGAASRSSVAEGCADKAEVVVAPRLIYRIRC